jgi:hypothetical protein
MHALGMSLSVYCHNYLCHRHAWLEMDDLIARFGEDHTCMHDDLKPHFFGNAGRQASPTGISRSHCTSKIRARPRTGRRLENAQRTKVGTRPSGELEFFPEVRPSY